MRSAKFCKWLSKSCLQSQNWCHFKILLIVFSVQIELLKAAAKRLRTFCSKLVNHCCLNYYANNIKLICDVNLNDFWKKGIPAYNCKIVSNLYTSQLKSNLLKQIIDFWAKSLINDSIPLKWMRNHYFFSHKFL